MLDPSSKLNRNASLNELSQSVVCFYVYVCEQNIATMLLHVDQTLGSGVGVWWGVCSQNICYNVAAFVIPFNLICNMTMFLEKKNFDLLTPPPGSRGGNLRVKYCYLAAAFVIHFNLICMLLH